MKRKVITLFVILTLLIATLPLLHHTPAAADEAVLIGLALPTLDDPFFYGINNGASAAAETLGVALAVRSADNDPAAELANVAALIEAGAAALLFSPVSAESSAEAIALANEAGVPIILVGADVRAEMIAAPVAVTVAADEVQGGEVAAAVLCAALNGAGTVVEILGAPDDLVAQQRSAGFASYSAEDCALEVVPFETAGMDRDTFKAAFTRLLKSQQVNGIVAINPAMTIPAIEAAIIARQTNLKIVGFDSSDDALSAVQRGNLSAMILPAGWSIGEKAVEAAAKLLAGEAVDEEILVGLGVLDLETVMRGPGPRSGNLEGDPRSGRLEGGPRSGNLEGGPGSGNLEKQTAN